MGLLLGGSVVGLRATSSKRAYVSNQWSKMTYLAGIIFLETRQAWDPGWIFFEAQSPGRMWQAVWPHDVPGVFLALYRRPQYHKLSLSLEFCLFLFSPANCRGSWCCFRESWRKQPQDNKSITNLDSILKSRDITLPTKVHLVKAMVLPVVMYGCESWTIKKAERQRIDVFELWC